MKSITIPSKKHHCKTCCKETAIKEHIVEKEETFDHLHDPITIYWDYLILSCGHEEELNSH